LLIFALGSFLAGPSQWFSPNTLSLGFPLLRSLSVIGEQEEDIGNIVNASPRLEELFWYAVPLRQGNNLEVWHFPFRLLHVILIVDLT
jgi:hypothetical protein